MNDRHIVTSPRALGKQCRAREEIVAGVRQPTRISFRFERRKPALMPWPQTGTSFARFTAIMHTTMSESLCEVSGPAAPEPVSIILPEGLLGLETWKQFELTGSTEEAPFLWLKSQQDLRIQFLVAPAFEVVPDYQPDIPSADIGKLQIRHPDDAQILAIVTLHPDGHATVNLKGPIVINRHTRLARQVVLANAAQYSVQHPLPVAS